ncbi:hypothetical protein ccbrp13_59350 [Ktedonobacteria bacterium brp13]|nr:hypothetical protein ccbrp13_59350 [Ktedonobacteria bacterium brp13]
MGVERAVTRWYLQRQTILNEIAQLEQRIAEIQRVNMLAIEVTSEKAQVIVATTSIDTTAESVESAKSTENTDIVERVEQSAAESVSLSMSVLRVSLSIKRIIASSDQTLTPEVAELVRQLQQVHARLVLLGPCPRPMMG